MLDKKKIDRINFLANKSKNEGLTEEEKKEQKSLRDEYIKAFRKNFKNRLDNIKVVDQEEYDKIMNEKN